METISDFLKLNLLQDTNHGNGYKYGDGNGDNTSYGDGDGYGYGNGNGNGFGDGDGYGDGNGNGLKSLNKQPIYIIDNIQTMIYSIRNNIALGAIVNSDLTLSKTYIVKNENYHAHGKTIKLAYKALEEKIYNNLVIEERIDKFKTKFINFSMKYKAIDLFDARNLLTNSCLQGKESFCKNNNINLTKDMFTVYEFIELTKNSYNGHIILKLFKL